MQVMTWEFVSPQGIHKRRKIPLSQKLCNSASVIFTFRARLQGNDGDKTQIGDNMIAGVTVFDTFLFLTAPSVYNSLLI